MKKLTSIILILFLSLLSSPSWSETLTIDDLVERDDLYYKKFTDVPFTGVVTGLASGKLQDGVPTGTFLEYHSNGQLKLRYEETLSEKDNSTAYNFVQGQNSATTPCLLDT